MDFAVVFGLLLRILQTKRALSYSYHVYKILLLTHEIFIATSKKKIKWENEWKFQTPHETWHVVIHNKNVCKAPTSLIDRMNQQAYPQNSSKYKLGGYW
jgi:hypothetical protein